ncbi:MAG: prolyl aminopeptidase [Acidimicrobiia bacterium]
MSRFAELEPFDVGMLDVGDGHRLYWEISGNPDGKPAVVLHGGPGSGSSLSFRRLFDPAVYKVVQFDQRNCGHSTPHASEPDVDLSTNTTAALIEDCEQIRTHLGIHRWLVLGGSWGTTLGLAYAQAHPGRVTEMILASVTTTTRREVEWITRSMGRIFPEAWARFRDAVPAQERDGDLSAAYYRLLQHADPHLREAAAKAWCDWEDTHVNTYGGYRHDSRYDDQRFRMCFARIVTHYWSNAAFLDDHQLVRDASRLAGIPGVLINGRLDISGPPDIAWHLAHEWSGSEFVLVDDAGHGAGHPSTINAIIAATSGFAARDRPELRSRRTWPTDRSA